MEPDAPEIDGLSDNEAPTLHGHPAVWSLERGADQLRCRWAPWDDGRGKGWIEITDPFTGERHQVPSKYTPSAPWHDPRYVPIDVVAEPAPQTFVWRAMDRKERTKQARITQQYDYDPNGGL